jgi:hypothetical protein
MEQKTNMTHSIATLSRFLHQLKIKALSHVRIPGVAAAVIVAVIAHFVADYPSALAMISALLLGITVMGMNTNLKPVLAIRHRPSSISS